jgi:thioredoxin 1
METEESHVFHLSDRNEFLTFIKNNPYVIVKATASWCGPCKRIKPFVDKWIELLRETSIKVVIIDGDQGPGIMRALRWRAYPTIGNFINGQPMDVVQGANEEQIEKLFQKTINRLKYA